MNRYVTAVCLLVVCVLATPAYTYAQGPEPIPEASIAVLKADLGKVKTLRASSTKRRRLCKGVIRKGQAVIKAHPKAPNRFLFYALILKGQRLLLGMERTQRNRDAFIETCKALAKAPDKYSVLRLNAEMILSDIELSAKDADAKERAKALEDMIKRYRNTSAELESLMIAIKLAPQLGAYTLKDHFLATLKQRFAGDSEAIAYSRTLLGASRLDVLFTGTFKRLDGTSMVFPYDRLGHPYFVFFWSKHSDRAMEKLQQLKKQQSEHPDLLELYSMNLDELPDAGKSVLDKMGLKCTILRLPGGRESQAFKTYALYQPTALRVNQYGHAIVPPTTEAHKKNEKDALEGNDAIRQSRGFDDFSFPISGNSRYKLSLDDADRMICQIRSLFIGDTLAHCNSVSPVMDAKTVNAATIEAVRQCFVMPPMRYRLTQEQEIAKYQKANALCRAAIAGNPRAPDAWRLRNYRIIALLGMANLKANPADFVQAVGEARAAISNPLPKGAEVIPGFCLGINAIRSGMSAKTALDKFISHCGGRDAGPIANSAACILAMYADSRDLYEIYRAAVLKSKDHPRCLDPIVSFLRDRYHQLYVFKGSTSFYLYDRIFLRFPEQNHLVNNSLTPMKDPLPPFKVKTLDGKTLSLPDSEMDKLTVLMFVEPLAKGNELPGPIYRPPAKPTKQRPNPPSGGELGNALAVEKQHATKGVKLITVFLTDNVNQAKAIRDKYSMEGTFSVLPGGLTNPIVNRLGILSADRYGNTLLIRRDGTIAWRKHGLIYQMIGKHRYYIASKALRHHVVACDVEAGYRALKAGDYRRAKRFFTESVGRSAEGWHKWTSSVRHGRALANLALKEYDEALTSIEAAIKKHLHRNQFNHDPDAPCTSMIHMLTTKAAILDALGRKAEARAARNKAAVEPTDYPTHYGRVRGFNRPYEAFENKMSTVTKEIK